MTGQGTVEREGQEMAIFKPFFENSDFPKDLTTDAAIHRAG